MSRAPAAGVAAALLLVTAPVGFADQPAPEPATSPSPAPPPPPLPPGLTETRLMAVELAVTAAMSRLGIPGLTAALAHASAPDVVWSRGYGLADVENDVAAGPSTVYRLASLSKPITAVAVLQLAEQGRLDLDAPIQRYVPAFPEKRWPVTPRQLLCHQGGVRHVTDEEWGSTRHYDSVVGALEVFKDDPLVFEPGTRASYSTYGYNLLGAAIESASGTRYLDYLRASVLAPSGSDGIRDDDPFALIRRRAHGYRRTPGGELTNSILADTSNKVPGGGLVGTAADVARFGAALLAGRLLQPAAVEAMLEPRKLRGGRRTEYTLGFQTTTWRKRHEVWHHGGQPRVSNLVYLLPDRGWVVVLLSNLEDVAPGLLDLARDVVGVAVDAPGLHR